jgi:hypothetical protein
MSRQNKLSQAASNVASALDQLNRGGNLSESDRAELQALVDSLCESGNSGGEGKGSTGKSGQGGKSSKFEGQMKGWAEGNPLEQDGEALAKALEELSDLIACECEGLAGMCDKMGMCEGLCNRDGDGNPGRGGVNRGRGDAELSFGEESSEQGAKFRDVAMPQGIADENGQLIETTFSVPEVNPIAPGGRSVARAAADATGDQTWKQPVRPRHREALKRYFGSSPSN